MEPGHGDPDTDIRIAAFARLRSLSHGAGGALPWSAIAQGFLARGRRFLFATTAEGIFRPVGMTGVLSIKTVVPNPKGCIWYHDQSSPDLSRGSDVFCMHSRVLTLTARAIDGSTMRWSSSFP